jgi:hypothetical protein
MDVVEGGQAVKIVGVRDHCSSFAVDRPHRPVTISFTEDIFENGKTKRVVAVGHVVGLKLIGEELYVEIVLDPGGLPAFGPTLGADTRKQRDCRLVRVDGIAWCRR